MPGAFGVDEARQKLEALEHLSPAGISRLIGIYGGRAGRIAELASETPGLNACIDAECDMLAAEVALVVREEMPRTLTDIVFRRMMIGLNADQGRAVYDAIARIAAAEFGWSDAEMGEQLSALNDYADSFRI